MKNKFLPLVCSLALLLPVSAHAQNEVLGTPPEVQAFVAEMASLHGFDAQELTLRLSQITPSSRVLQLIAPPGKPAQRSWQRYRSRFIEESRIKQGVRFWQENSATLAKARVLYGVPEEVIVAIIGVETIYGRNTGSFNTLEALATLAFLSPNRAGYFRQELEQLLLLARENGVDPACYTGSFAGALGIPQFMPGSLRRYAEDFDGDGRIDLEGSRADAIGSVARFLEQHGWQQGEPVAVPAYLSQAPDQAWIEAGIRPSLDTGMLLATGVRADALPERKVTFVDLVTPGQATEYWLGYENFYVITRYNRSSFYAMSVHQLAKALRQRYQTVDSQAPL
ncbi:MAG: lytic murein transglycosylase B [Azovibrio sp.]|uniref:lytic murein transglycosylase B n=1 Tax=Azovibrio sp. TaxID=1872673 RepID=UPI003C739B2F